MVRGALLLAAVLAAISPAANAASAIFVEKARLADPTKPPAGADDRAVYDHMTFERSIGLHTIVPGEGLVIAVRNSVELTGIQADSSYFEKLTIALPNVTSRFETGFGDERVTIRYVQGPTYFPFSPDDIDSGSATGTMSVRRDDESDALIVEFKVSFDVKTKRRLDGVPIMDCVGRGRAAHTAREDLTPFFGAPVDFQHKFSAIKPGKAKINDASFYLYCDWRRAKQ